MNNEYLKKIMKISIIIVIIIRIILLVYYAAQSDSYSLWTFISEIDSIIVSLAPIVGLYTIILFLEDIYNRLPIPVYINNNPKNTNTKKICHSCSSVCKDDSVFCEFCGNKL